MKLFLMKRIKEQRRLCVINNYFRGKEAEERTYLTGLCERKEQQGLAQPWDDKGRRK